jgi:uncharacterized protein YdeI (YjbR/CyaY-like superfamily)
MSTNPAIDEYIQKAKPFAQPILIHLRKLVHQACPMVDEKLKWGMPCFEYKGIMCNFAAFKEHCVFGFWKASLMSDPMLMENAKSEKAMGHFSRITSLKDLPADNKIIDYIKEAMKLNDDGVKLVKAKPPNQKELVIPTEILSVIRQNKKAYSIFEAFSPSNKREYIDWIDELRPKQPKIKDLPKRLNGWRRENLEIGNI